jgi:FixJ family two-component response regulator
LPALVERKNKSKPEQLTLLRVYVVDDEIQVLDVIRKQLELEGYTVDTYFDPTLFVEQIDKLEPGVVISDQRMPRLEGLDVQQHLQTRKTSFPLILISGFPETRVSVEAMRYGAITVLDKPYRIAELLSAVEEGFAVLERALQSESEKQEVPDLPQPLPGYELYQDRLSPREREVINLVYAGATNKSIGIALNISIKTVEKHRGKAMRKLEVSSLAELIRLIDRERRIDN